MPGKDGRDSLDEWLDREVRPLPPPSGTFELITRRARRRKLRKLAVTVTSAAAVAAAAVFAVPTVALRLSTPHETGVASAANRGSTTPSQNTLTSPSVSATTPLPNSVTAPVTPGSTPVPGTVPVVTPPAGGKVPPNFQPTSVTFVSAYEGWTIGQAGTPGTCANQDPTVCTSMARTNDRGKTWTGVPAPSTKLVSGIRFLDGVNGWAFGPQLWSTHDRGNTWTQVNTHGRDVIGLETGGNEAFAVFAACGDTTVTYATTQSCTSYTLEAAQAGTDTWSAVSPATTGMSDGGNAGSWATIALGNGGAWLLGPDGTIYSGPDTGAGSWRTAGKAPCAPTRLLTWVKFSQSLITSCSTQAPPPSGQVITSLYTSADGGMTWSAADTAQSGGQVRSLSGSPSAPVILATSSGIDIRTSPGHEKQVASLKGGFTYVGMTGDNQGVAVPADVSLHQIWMTYDGGLQWTAYQVSP
jgi:hypothetical protein